MSDSALIEMLARPENIRYALQIAEAIEDVKRKLRSTFWEQAAIDSQDGLRGNGLADRWVVDGIENFRRDPAALGKDYVGVFVVSNELQQAKTRLRSACGKSGTEMDG
jgi:hypothetical protein